MADNTKSIFVEYYAFFRETLGRRDETVSTTAASARDLFDELVARYGLPTGVDTIRVAVNDRIVPWNTMLADGDTVVFLTPFGGG